MGNPKVIINGHEVMEFSPSVRDPITKNDRHTARCNAIFLQNTGTRVARIDDNWTLYPGGTLELGSQSDYNILVWEFHVQFIGGSVIPGQEPRSRLEIIEWHLHHPETAHWKEQG